jgi:phosphohistidine phosphatase SixA
MSQQQYSQEDLAQINQKSKNANHYVSMIFTHQARMRCFVRKSIEPIVGREKQKSVFSNDDEYNALDNDEPGFEEEPIREQKSVTDSSVFSNDDEYNALDNDEPDFEEEQIREQILSRPADLDEDYLSAPSSEEGAVVGGNGNWKLPRFKNGSVLRCIITHDKIKFDLLVEGEIDEKKPKYVYYVKSENVSNDAGALLGKYKVTAFDPMELINTTYPIGKDDTYVFYIVRHGQATHNVLKGMTQKIGSALSGQKDTTLTLEGSHQANRSGAEFAKLFVDKGDSTGDQDGNIGLAPKYIFTSDLRRTRQTAQYFLTSLTVNISNLVMAASIISNNRKYRWIVLPCAHELAFVNSGYCDGFQNPLLPTPPENQMTCDGKDKSCGIITGDFTINWDHYSRFYGSSTRSNICRGCGARHCRDTDMIKEAITIIQKHPRSPSQQSASQQPASQQPASQQSAPPRSPSQQPASQQPAPPRGSRVVRFAYGTKTTGGKTRRRHKHKKKKTRKSHTRKRLTRGKRKNAHNKAKKTKKSKK